MVCEIGGSSRELGNNGAVRNDLGRLSLCAVSVTLTLTDDSFDCFSGVVCVSPTATTPRPRDTPNNAFQVRQYNYHPLAVAIPRYDSRNHLAVVASSKGVRVEV